MSGVHYNGTTTDEVLSCDQPEVSCPCGRTSSPVWELWPLVKLTSIRLLQPRMVCQRCGKGRPTNRILSHAGGGMRPVWE